MATTSDIDISTTVIHHETTCSTISPVVVSESSTKRSSSPTKQSCPAPRVWTKRILKKRTNHLSEYTSDPAKPHTPRRKLNCGNIFEDVDASLIRNEHKNQDPDAHHHHPRYPHPQVHHHNWWNMTHDRRMSRDDLSLIDPHPHTSDPSLEFDFDTRCLDGYLGLVSPRLTSSLDLISPHCHESKKKTAEFRTKVSPSSASSTLPLFVELTHAPKLVRTESIEQSALSAYFKHTHIDLSSPGSPRLTTEDLLIHNINPLKKSSASEDFDFHSLLPQDCELNGDLDQELDAYYFESLPTSEQKAVE